MFSISFIVLQIILQITVDQHSNESSLIKILKQQFYINSSCVILVIH